MENFNWIDNLISDDVLNPISKEAEITKEAFVTEADDEAFKDGDQQLAACQLRKKQIEEGIRNGSAMPAERDELAELNREINELLDFRNLKRKEIYTPHMAATKLTENELYMASQAYPELSATRSDVKAALQVMFPAMADEDYKYVKASHWDSVFNGPMLHTADLEGLREIGADQLGHIVDDLMEFEGNKEARLESFHHITNAELKEEILARAMAVSGSLGQRLNGARVVVYDENSELTYVWRGGHTVNIYDETGYEVDMFSTGDFSQTHANESAVRQSIEDHIARGVEGSKRTAIHDSDDMQHRDPESRFQDPHLQQSGPHSSGPGMVEMADATSKPSWPSIMSMPGEDIRELPTISQGQFDNLKFDDGKHRVWVSRMTQEDGAEFDNEVYVEILQNGVWRRASKKTADRWVRDPNNPQNLIRMEDHPPIPNAYSDDDFSNILPDDEPAPAKPVAVPSAKPAASETDEESQLKEYMNGLAPKQQAPAPAPAQTPAAPATPPPPPAQPEAPAEQPDKDELQKMVDLKVSWKLLSEQIEKHVKSFREKIIEEMAKTAPLTSNPIEMQKMVKEQEPALKNALAMVDGMARVSQGFKVFLQQVSGSNRFQYGNAWKTLKENAGRITEAGTMADERIYNAMMELEQVQSLYTYVDPTENIGVIPENDNKPSRVKKTKTSLDWSGLEVEAAPITQKFKEYYARLTDWCKRTLLPLLSGTAKSFESLQEAMDTILDSTDITNKGD